MVRVASTMNYFEDQLDVVRAVLKMLNETEIPEDGSGGFHIQVTLHDEFGQKVGFFSDEIAPDAWYFQPEVFGVD